MTPREILAAYNKMPTDHALPVMQVARLKLVSDELDNPDAVWTRVRDFEPSAGWLCFQSVIKEVGDEGWLDPPDQESGSLLSTECFSQANGESLHVRQNGRGGWRLTRYMPGSGGEFLTDEVALLAHEPEETAPRYLHYRRYWDIDAETGASATAACFIGYRE